MTNSESPLINMCLALRFNNVSKSTFKASYSASLLEHKGLISKRILTGVLFGEIKTTPIPEPPTSFEPSKYNKLATEHQLVHQTHSICD